MGQARFFLRNFESYLRFIIGSDEDDIQVIFRQ